MKSNKSFNYRADRKINPGAGNWNLNSDLLEDTVPGRDEPQKIDIFLYFEMFRKSWKILLGLVLVTGVLNVVIHPAAETAVYGAKATVYIPPYTTQEVNGQERAVSNNASQLPNAIGLIQTKVYQDKIADQLGVGNISEAGSYALLKKEKTDIVEFNCQASSLDKAELLCQAVLDIFENDAIREATMSEIEIINPVSVYSNVTRTSAMRSFITGGLTGLLLYVIYCSYEFITSKKFHSKEETEDYLGIPVLSVMLDIHK